MEKYNLKVVTRKPASMTSALVWESLCEEIGPIILHLVQAPA